MENFVQSNKMVLRMSVEERALSKKAQDDQKKRVSYLDEDCVSNILVHLPFQAVQISRLVCKQWHSIINSPCFIEAHLCRSESVLIFLKSVQKERFYPYHLMSMPPEQQSTFSVEASLLKGKSIPIFGEPINNTSTRFDILFMEFQEGKGKIGEYKISCLGNLRASCNGLILLDNKMKRGGLIVMNPVTKKVMALPVGTLFPRRNESYGFAFSHATGDYKVVHLFRDEMGYVGCEMLNLRARLWREVNGPIFGIFGWFGYNPVSAIGALHWIPQIDRSDCIVSLDVDNERFHTIQLPRSCRTHDRIIEMGGYLCFITHESLNIEIWNLKSLSSGVLWTKQYSITTGTVIDMVPLFSLRIGGDLIFKRDEDHSIYAYDFKLQSMREIEIDEKFAPIRSSYLPHVSSLISW